MAGTFYLVPAMVQNLLNMSWAEGTFATCCILVNVTISLILRVLVVLGWIWVLWNLTHALYKYFNLAQERAT